MVNPPGSFPPVHCSPKEVHSLRKSGYTYEEIGETLGVSTAHAHRVGNGYKCRCGDCSPVRSRSELVALAEGPANKKPPVMKRPREGRDNGGNGGLNILQLLALIKAAQDVQEAPVTKKEDGEPPRGKMGL